MAIRRSASNNPTPTVQIFAKFYSWGFHRIFFTKFSLDLKQTKMDDIQYTV
jgi:hypothetical protein